MAFSSSPDITRVRMDEQRYQFLPRLNRACWDGDSDTIKLLATSAKQVNITDDEGNTPLHLAAMQGYLDIAKFLIKKGALVNVSNKNNVTPLHSACKAGYLGVARYLIRKGAVLDVKDDDGNKPLDLLPRSNTQRYEFAVKQLVEARAKYTSTGKSSFWVPLLVILSTLFVLFYLRLQFDMFTSWL
uniref:Uncharacterized protein n=1 Tax=Vannella robusta TaxID=1487602 RepID=A0A7S4I826_9EUKA